MRKSVIFSIFLSILIVILTVSVFNNRDDLSLNPLNKILVFN